jgi:hypothetical protein
MTLVQGQDTLLLLLIFTLVLIFQKKNADFAVGCCLGLGLFRFHSVLPLVLVLLLMRKRNAVLGFMSIAVVLLLVSIGLVGWRTVVHYPEYVMHLEAVGAGGAIVPANMPTIHGLLDPIIRARLGNLGTTAFVGIVSAVLLFVAAYWPRNRQVNFDLHFSLVLVITVLVSYHAYAHDLSLLLLPQILVANYLLSHSISESVKLSIVVPMFLLFLSPLYVILWFRYSYMNLLGLVLLWWAWQLWREMSRQRAKTPLDSLELHGAR